MNYKYLRSLLYDMVFMESKMIPKEFSMKNKKFLIKYVDFSLRRYCSLMFKKDASKLKIALITLASLISFYFIRNKWFPSLQPSKATFWVILFLIYTNLNFIFSSGIVKVIHRTHIRSHYKVIKKRTLNNRKGYYLAYIGMDSKNRVVVVSLEKLKKRIKLHNPRVFLVTESCLYSIIIEYLYSDKVKDLSWLKYDIFIGVNGEYYKNSQREYALDILEEMEKSERNVSHV